MTAPRTTLAIGLFLLAGMLCDSARGQNCSSPPPSSYNITFDSNRTGNYEIYTMRTNGTNQTQLTNDPAYDSWWSRVSPDWTTILFYRTPAGVHDSDYTQTSLWEMNADGSNLRQVIANKALWAVMGHGEWSPDGTLIVMLGGPATGLTSQIYITPADASWNAPVTSSNRLHLDPSFSPDQQKVLYISCATYGCASTAYQVYSTSSLGGGAETPLTSFTNRYSQNDPYYSPDGNTIAWLVKWNPTSHGGWGSWGIDSIPASGGSHTAIVDDGSITSLPRWSAKGNWIYTHRYDFTNHRFEIYRVCANGKNLTGITTNNTDLTDEYAGPEYLTGVIGKVTPPSGTLTPGNLYNLTGSNLSSGTASANPPYPLILKGTTVSMRDALGNQMSAGISYVSPTLVTFQLPATAAAGYGVVWVKNSSGNMYSAVVDVN